MMFGEEYGSILGNGTCTRCGSVAKLRGLQRSGTHIVVCHTTCRKCHRIEFTGFTTIQALARETVKNKLEKLLESTENPRAIRRIEQQLSVLDQQKKLDDLGL